MSDLLPCPACLDADYLRAVLCDSAVLMDGWHADGTAWSEWDEWVRQRVRVALAHVMDHHLSTETAAIQKVRDEMAKWGEAMPTSVVRQCVAALDAILEGRK